MVSYKPFALSTKEESLAGLLADILLEGDHGYFPSVSGPCGVTLRLVFLFKTSRVRTPETSADYCKLGSGDVIREGGGHEGLPYPVSNYSQRKNEKYCMGPLRSFDDTALQYITQLMDNL